MNLVQKSKKLSWLLRHGALEAGLTMDAAGWAPVAEVLHLTHLSAHQLTRVVAENNKSRLEIDGDRIRCSQGHSMQGMPVTQDALEASWMAPIRTRPVWHGTRVAVVDSILESGIQPMRRSHVHLADSPESRVGKRSGVGMLLEIDPQRLDGLWVSSNGVWLTRVVPPTAIVGLRALTKRARAALPALDARLRQGPSTCRPKFRPG